MNFSSLIIPINNKSKGIFKFYIQNQFNNLELIIELHKILFNIDDIELINTVMKSITDKCDVNPLNNEDIFNSISTKIIIKKNLNYYQIEEIISNLDFIQNYSDLNEKIQLPSNLFGIKVTISVRDVKRIQRYINSFLFNYSILLDTIRYVDNQINNQINKPSGLFDNINNENCTNAKATLSSCSAPRAASDSTSNSVEDAVAIKIGKTMVDEILEFLIVSPHLQSYLIHLICNYYRYFKISEINKKEDKNIILCFGNIFQNDLSINKPYILGLIESIQKVSLEKINLLTKNLIKYIFTVSNEIQPLQIQACVYILFFYSLRHILETHESWVKDNIENIFSNCKNQEKILNKYITKISDYPIKFVFKPEKEIENQEYNIDEISTKYNYLKELDQEKFADYVFDETSKGHTDDSFEIGIKNILNVDKLIDYKTLKSDLIENKVLQNLNSLIYYQRKPENKKIITDTFKHFLKFIDNPVYITTIKNSIIPNNILNSFEMLKNILNDKNFNNTEINTFQYYKILKKFFPNDFQFTNYLYIIYQIIIPYMYYFYNISEFEDCFLTKTISI